MRSITSWRGHARSRREPPLALIRLQWWREVVEGARRRHEVADAAREAPSRRATWTRADLLALIDARETEAEPAIADAGGVAGLCARDRRRPGGGGRRACWARTSPRRLRPLGAAYGVAGLLRSVPAHAGQGRCLLPEDVLAAHGLTPEQVIATPTTSAVQAVVRRLAEDALGVLGRAKRLPRQAIAAGLPAVLARRDLQRAPRFIAQRGLGDRLAVTLAGLVGRV